MNRLARFFQLVLVFSFFVSASGATVAPIKFEAKNRIKLSDYKGSTFFEVMTMKNGIKQRLEDLNEQEFTLVDASKAQDTWSKFSDKVKDNVMRDVRTERGREKEESFEALVEELKDSTFVPASFKKTLSKYGARPWAVSDFLQMASGAALMVRLDANNYYYNVNYLKYSPLDDEEKDREHKDRVVNSGRSFAAGPSHEADDASYPFFLRNFKVYLENIDDVGPVYTALMAILTKSDPSAQSELSDQTIEATVQEADARGKTKNIPVSIDGQTLLSDLIAIYTAELYRNLVSNLKSHDWQNALLEMFLLASYAEQEGYDVRDFRYVGTEGSGIGGKPGQRRRKFQGKVCQAARDLGWASVQAIDKIVGFNPKYPDCFHAVARFLNKYQQDDVKANADALATAVVNFALQIRKESKALNVGVPDLTRN